MFNFIFNIANKKRAYIKKQEKLFNIWKLISPKNGTYTS